MKVFEWNLQYLCLDTRTTQWEDPRLSNPQIAGPAIPYSRDYKRKYEYMKTQLRKPVSINDKPITVIWFKSREKLLFC